MDLSSYEPIINAAAEENGLNPNLLKAVIKVESGGNPRAVSPQNAQGLMQFIPSTAARFGVSDAMDPVQSIKAGAQYLKVLHDRYEGDTTKALMAYHAGEGNMDLHLQGQPSGVGPKTKNYPRKVWAAFQSMLGPSEAQAADLPQNPPIAAAPRRAMPPISGLTTDAVVPGIAPEQPQTGGIVDPFKAEVPAVAQSSDGIVDPFKPSPTTEAANPFMPVGQKGQPGAPIVEGNIDMRYRPQVPNQGKTSTVYSMSIGTDQGETLIPRVSDDGRVLSESEAIQQFRDTGKHLGIFTTPQEATAYADKLHESEAAKMDTGIVDPFKHDEKLQTAIPKNAPDWAREHPDAYWKIADVINSSAGEVGTDIGALTLGAKLGVAAGVTLGSPSGPGAALTGLIGALGGAGLTYAMKGQIVDLIKQYLGMEKDKGAVEMAGKGAEDFAKGVAYQGTGEILGAAGAGLYKEIAKGYVPFSEAAVEKKAGDILAKNISQKPLPEGGYADSNVAYGENARAAQKLESEIPGLNLPVDAQRFDPAQIKLFRSLESGPGPMASATLENRAANLQALREYLRNEYTGTETIDDVIAALNAKKAGLAGQATGASSAVEQGVSSLPAGDIQETGRSVSKAITEERAPIKTKVETKYQDLGNPEVPVSNTKTAVDKMKSEFRPGDEEAFPKASVSRIDRTLATEPAEPGLLVGPNGQPIGGKAAVPKEEVGFQDLHSLRKDIGQRLNDALSGANPNRPLARNLRTLKDAIDADIEAGMGANNAYVEARTAYADYAKRFRSGEVGNITQRGRQASGLNLTDEEIAKRVFKVSGADDFIRALGGEDVALGVERAKPIMIRHAADDLRTYGAINEAGEIDPRKFDTWFRKNKGVLDKYNLRSEFSSLRQLQGTLDAAKAAEDSFNKSIAAKMLGSDTKTAIERAFAGGGEGISPKNTGDIAQKIMDQLQGDTRAVAGFKNAFNDFMVDQAQNTAKTISGEKIVSPSGISKAMSKYDEALKVIYANEPQKIEALRKVQEAIEIQSRSASSPIKGGSDTTEKGGMLISVLDHLSGKVPGGPVLRRMLSKIGKEEVADLLVKSRFDPDLAQMLINKSRGEISNAFFERQINHYKTTGAVYAIWNPVKMLTATGEIMDLPRKITEQGATQ